MGEKTKLSKVSKGWPQTIFQEGLRKQPRSRISAASLLKCKKNVCDSCTKLKIEFLISWSGSNLENKQSRFRKLMKKYK